MRIGDIEAQKNTANTSGNPARQDLSFSLTTPSSPNGRSGNRRNALTGYLAALLVSGVSTLLIVWLQNAIRSAGGEVHRPYTIFYVCAIAPIVFFYGVGPGLVVLGTALAVTYVWLAPGFAAAGTHTMLLRDGAELTALTIAGVLVIWGAASHRRQRRQLQSAFAHLEAMYAARERVLADVLKAATQGKLLLYTSDEAMPSLLSGEATIKLSQPQDLAVLRAAMRASRPGQIPDDDRMFRFLTAAHETAMNALRHGGGGIAMIGFTDEARETLAVQVTDSGPGIELEQLPQRALQDGVSGVDSLGMGFSLVLDGVDRIHLRTSPRGTRVLLEMDREPPAPTWFKRLLGE